MNNGKEISCDWKNCGAVAVAHLRYGFSADPNKAPVVGLHGDYCGRHIDYIEDAFSTTRRFPLGECPDGCDFDGMRVITKANESTETGAPKGRT